MGGGGEEGRGGVGGGREGVMGLVRLGRGEAARVSSGYEVRRDKH